MSAFDDLLARVAELRRRGEAFVLATVVRVEAPTSGRPGDKAVVDASGRVWGWVGGSCAEPVVAQEAQTVLREGRSRLLRLTPQVGREPLRQGMTDLPMTCFSGGAMEIFLEPHLARPHLLVFGASPIGRALVALARVLDYRVTLVELGGRDVAGIEADRVVLTQSDLDELDEEAGAAPGGEASARESVAAPTPTYALVATHGTFDEEALEHAIALAADYLGLVTSRRRFEAIRDELLARDLEEAAIDRIRAPAGIDIQAQRPEEIALSILAEIVQLRRRQDEEAAVRSQRTHASPPGGSEKAAAVSGSETASRRLNAGSGAEAVDPVCGMTVATDKSLHRLEHQGVVYHFCCAGCRRKFAESPDNFLATAPR